MSSEGHLTVAFGPFVANLATGELWRDGARVSLQHQPAVALRCLIEAGGAPVSRAALAAALWPASVHVDFERGLTATMHKLRLALGDTGRPHAIIETLPRRGYRFIGSITPVVAARPTTRWRRAGSWIARRGVRPRRVVAAAMLIATLILPGADRVSAGSACTYLSLARARRVAMDASTATALADRALALAPDDAHVVALAGFYAGGAEQYERERELIERAAAMAPASPFVLLHLALCQARRNQIATAIDTLDRALAIEPDAPDALHWRQVLTSLP